MINNYLRSTYKYKTIHMIAILHVSTLIFIRTIFGADDFSNWDLISFLNANTADSLWELLKRPEVHFINPFSFPLYNVGAESVLSAILFSALKNISLYWSNVIILFVYDIIFLFLLYKFISKIFVDNFHKTLSWILLSMSPVLLTFASTSAFNMQGYCVIVLGLYGSECFLNKRIITGCALLALAFVFISQAYPLAFFLPYFVAVWLLWRIFTGSISENTSQHLNLSSIIHATLCLFYISLLSLIVHYASDGIYLKKISPLNPHDNGNLFNSANLLFSRMLLFLRQSFSPVIKVDGLIFGFAPYFIYLTIFLIILIIILKLIKENSVSKTFLTGSTLNCRELLFIAASFILVSFGYVPAFLNPVVKSQRAVFGDIFLVIVITVLISHLEIRNFLTKKQIALIFCILTFISDTYYLTVVLSVDHSRNHSPSFDFDLSDGQIRHDLIDAIKLMKKQVNRERPLLVIYYPRGYSENTTDPGMFFAHFLRHFGSFNKSANLVFPCKWCDKRYGCPFPDVGVEKCTYTCCYASPETAVQKAMDIGMKVIIWQWHDSDLNMPAEFPNKKLKIINLNLPYNLNAQIFNWTCYELIRK